MVPTVGEETAASRLIALPTWQLSRAAARSHQILHERLQSVGFTGYEFRVLAAVGDARTLSQADVGRRAELDRRDVALTVRELEARGLIERAPDPAHRQRKLVSLTGLGKTALTDLERDLADVQREVFGSLSEAELSALLGYLVRLGV